MAGDPHGAAAVGAARDLRLLPGDECHLLDLCRPGGSDQPRADRARLHGGSGVQIPEGILVVRLPAGDRRHRSAHRLRDPPAERAVLPLEGDDGMSDHEAPESRPTSGEPGTIAVTVPTKGQPATYRHEPSAETPKLRVSHVSISYIDRAGRATEAVRDVSFDILNKPNRGDIVVFLGPSGCRKPT